MATNNSPPLVNNSDEIYQILNVTTDTPGEEQGLCSDSFPETKIYYKDIENNILDAFLIATCCLLTLITIILFLLETRVVIRAYNDPLKRQRTLIVLGIYPVESLLSCMALLIPRGTTLADLTASCYLSVCIYMFLGILFMYFGGPDHMAQMLGPTKLHTNVPPCCCCCVFLPKLTMTRKKLTIVQRMVMQVAVIRPLLLYITALLWTDNRQIMGDVSGKSAYLYITIITTISTLLALYNLQILVKASLEFLSGHRIKLKFFLIQMVLIITNLQNIVFAVLAKNNLPACRGVLGSRPRATNYNHMLIILEMFLLSLAAMRAYRRSENRSINEDRSAKEHCENPSHYGAISSTMDTAVLPQQDSMVEIKNFISETI